MKIRNFTLIFLLIAFCAEVNAQSVSITPEHTSGTCSDYVVTFDGIASSVATSFDFDGGTTPPGWSTSPYTISSTICSNHPSPDNSNYFWATSLGTESPYIGLRYVQTNAVDVSSGGTISFYMLYGDGIDPDCEQPDLPVEEVWLQYSTNGSSWTTIYDGWETSSSNAQPWYNWYFASLSIPAGAQTSGTYFRWYQASNSGACCDNWGLDNVSIGTNVTATGYKWYVDGTQVAITEDLTYTFPATGTYTVKFETTFSNGSIKSSTINYEVNENQIPTLNSISDLTVQMNSIQQTVSLSGISDGDCVSQTVSLSTASGNTNIIGTPTYSYTSANSTGSLYYTPVADTFGTVQLTVTVTDNAANSYGMSKSISKNFNVYVNDVPTVPGSFILPTGSKLTIDYDYDIEWGGSTDQTAGVSYYLEYSRNGGSWTSIGAGTGSTAYNNWGGHKNVAYVGQNVQFRVRAYDGTYYSGYTYSNMYEIIENTPPVANDDGTFIVYTGGNIAQNVLTNDTDADDDDLDVVSEPTLSQGSFTSFDLETGDFIYQAPTDFSGEVTFSYTATDGLHTDNATVTFTIIDTIPPSLTVPADIYEYADADQCGTVVSFEGETEDIDLSQSNLKYPENYDLWQSFVPGVTGLLKKIQLKHDGTHDLSFTFDIYVGEGNSGQHLYSQDYYLGEFGDGWFDIELPIESALILAAGTTYTFRISGMYGNILGNSDDVYKQGRMTSREDWDLCFRTDVVEGVIAFDNTADIEVSQTTGLTSGSVFPVGETVNTFLATDASGNTTQRSFKVTVEDNTNPVVAAKNITVFLDSTGLAAIDAEDIDDGSTDACGIQSMSVSPNSFTCAEEGENTVALTVTDNNGNISTYSSAVTVMDTVPPVILCQDTMVYLDKGIANIDTSFVYNSSSDACGIADVWLNKTNFNGSNVGANSVTVLASDVNGNISTCISTVTVKDTIAPEANCQNIGITLDKEGEARIYPAFINKGSTDAGGIASYNLDITKFSCQDIGKNTVVLSVKDVGGNVSTCEATVTISDNWLPEVACNDIEVSIGTEGFAVIDSSMIDNGTSTICGIAGIELSQSVFTGADLGENLVTMTVRNKSGITSSCEAKVTVKDEIAPVASCNSIDIWLSDSAIYELTGDDIFNITNGSIDNASTYDRLYIEISPTTFDCSSIGDSVKVEVSITDEAGNETTCETIVFVNDSIQVQLNSLENIEISLAAGVCETEIDYPGLFTDKPCTSFTQLEGFGPNGVYPVGTTEEKWLLSNIRGDSLEFSFFVNVTAGNLVPTLDPVSDVDTSGRVSELVIPLSGISFGDDCAEQEIMVKASGINHDVVSDISVNYSSPDSTAELMLAIAAFANGSDTITVTVEDSDGGKVTQLFAVSVDYSNQAPVVVNPVADQGIIAGRVLAIPLSNDLGVIFDDPDSDVLALIATMEDGSNFPSWMSFENDTLFTKPTIQDTGCVNLVLIATDGAGAMVSDTFRVCVEGFPVSIETIESGEYEIVMYPNPTKGEVTVDMNTANIYNTVISVMDITGKLVLQKYYSATEKMKFDMADKVSGMYLVHIDFNGNHIIKKLQVSRK